MIKRLRGRSAAELRGRASQLVASWLERSRLLDAVEPSDASFLSTLSAVVTERTPKGWLEHFRGRPSPRFFGAFENPEAAVTAIRSVDVAFETEVIKKADRLIGGRFDLLGHEGLEYGTAPDWHLDRVSGIRAPRQHWSTIDYLDPALVGDHKVTWELNRQQWLVTLGMAYWFSGDEAYARAMVSAMSSWLDDNPPKLGINWASSLEVAFRAISWLWALHFLRRASALTPQVFARVSKALVLHARHLERNLSTWFSPNTHLSGEALGLFYIGLLMPEVRGADGWRDRGLEVLVHCLPVHARPDGVYFEQAVYYQRYTVDFYLHALILAERNGLPLRERVGPRLTSLLEHFEYLARANGTVPLVGDDDGGRLLFLDSRRTSDVRSPMATGAVLFGRPDFAWVAGGASPELVWLLGGDAPKRLASLGAKAPEETSRAFPDGGVYVMRDGWDADARQMVIDCGPHGTMNCGHAHADALSFELSVAGEAVLVDPGTYDYTASPELRDAFRSTGVHNTLVLDDLSSSEMAGPFRWASVARCETLDWRVFASADWFEGRHDGYRRLAVPAWHRRGVLFVRRGYWVVRDIVESDGPHDASLTFQGAESARLGETAAREANEVDFVINERAAVRVACFADGGRMETEEGWVSPCYGARVRAPRCRFRLRTASGASMVSFLLAPDARGSFPSVTRIASDRGWAFEVSGRGYRDVVLFDAQGSSAGGVSPNAALAWVRRGAGGEPESLMFAGGSALSVGDVTLEANDAGSAVRDRGAWRVEGESAFVREGQRSPERGAGPRAVSTR